MDIPNIDPQTWLSISIVFIGGIITYYVSSFIEKKRHRSEMKKQVYFEVLELVGDLAIIIDDEDFFHTQKIAPEMISKAVEYQDKRKWDLLKWTERSAIADYKIAVCGNQDVLKAFISRDDLFVNADRTDKGLKFNSEEFGRFEAELIEAIRKDLIDISFVDRLSTQVKDILNSKIFKRES